MKKEFTKKQKVMAGVAAGAIALTIGVVGVTTMMDNGFDNAPKQETVVEKKFELKLKYKEEPKDEYVVTIDGEKVTVKTKDVKPEIDTSKLGKTEYAVTVDGKEIILVIIVEDKRTIDLELEKDKKIEVKVGEVSIEELESTLIKTLDLKVENKDEKVEYIFNYPKGFDKELKTEGEFEVTVTARFTDNRKNNTKEVVPVIISLPEIEEEVPAVQEPQIPEETTPEDDVVYNDGEVGDDGVYTEGPDYSGVSDNDDDYSEPAPTTPAPSQPAPTTPAPSEPAPEPTPAPVQPLQPEDVPSIGVPVGIPSGAVLTEDYPSDKQHAFAYNKSLGGNAKVDNTVVNYGVGRVLLSGSDENGNVLSVSYESGQMKFMFDYPTLSSAQMDELENIARSFLGAYGF